MRLRKVIRKEAIDFKRDKGFILTLILEPLILILVFGYTFQADITGLSTVVVDDDSSEYSQQIIDAIHDSKYFEHVQSEMSREQAIDELLEGRVRAVFYIPNNFSEQISNAQQAKVYLFIDSSDYLVYNIIKGGSAEVVKDALQGIVSVVIDDIESERDLKEQRVRELELLVDSIDQKATDTLDRVAGLTDHFEQMRVLLRDTNRKIGVSQEEMSDISSQVESLSNDLEDSLLAINDLKNSLSQLQTICPASSDAVSAIIREVEKVQRDLLVSADSIDELDPSNRITLSSEHYNMNQFSKKLDKNEEEVKGIERTAHELEETYRDIQQRMKAIDLELSMLKKEFLSEPLILEDQYVHGEISYFQYLAPAIMTLILFFIGVVLTTINVVDERKSKTLFRISTTPLKKWELYGGKFIVFFIVGIIAAMYVLLLAMVLFNVTIVGSLFSVFIVLTLLMAASIGLGLLVSTVVRSMRQAIMLVPLVIIPAVLISQTFSPIEVMPRFMQYLSYLSPMLYSNIALREIMIKGTSIGGVLPQVLLLALYAFITVLLGVLVSKKRIK